MLFPSSSATLGVPEEKSEGAASDVGPDMPALSAFFCCISLEIRSAGSASITFSATVGNNSRTVIVQSSWFCWNLRRRLLQVNSCWKPQVFKTILLLRYPVVGDLLSGLTDLGEDVLSCNIAHSNHTSPKSQIGPVASQPSSRCVYHYRPRCSFFKLAVV